jgi:hypothetical protein
VSIATEDRRASGSLSASWNGSGTAPANSSVEINAPGASVVTVQLTAAAFTGTLAFEGLIDEVNGAWFPLNAYVIAQGAAVQTLSLTGAVALQYALPMAGLCRVHVRCSAYTSGSVNVAIRASSGSPLKMGGAPQGAGAFGAGGLDLNAVGLWRAANSYGPWLDAAGAPSLIGRGAVTPGTAPMTSLAAATATGAGTSFNLGCAVNTVGVQITDTGAPAAISVTLQASYDLGGTWTNVGSAITAVGVTVFQNVCAPMLRLNLGTLTGGTSPTVTGIMCGY